MSKESLGPSCLAVQVFNDCLRQHWESFLPQLLIATRDGIKRRQEYLDADNPAKYKRQYVRLLSGMGFSAKRFPSLDFDDVTSEPSLKEEEVHTEEAPIGLSQEVDLDDDGAWLDTVSEDRTERADLLYQLNGVLEPVLPSVLNQTKGLRLVLIPIRFEGKIYIAVLTACGRIAKRDLEYHMTFTVSGYRKLEETPTDVILRDNWGNVAGKKFDLASMGIVSEEEDRVVWTQFIQHKPGIKFRSWFNQISSTGRKDIDGGKSSFLLTESEPYVVSRGGPWPVLVIHPLVEAVA